MSKVIGTLRGNISGDGEVLAVQGLVGGIKL